MPLVQIIVALILVGAALYLIGLLPIDNTMKQIIYVLVVVVVILWIISALGLLTGPALRLH